MGFIIFMIVVVFFVVFCLQRKAISPPLWVVKQPRWAKGVISFECLFVRSSSVCGVLFKVMKKVSFYVHNICILINEQHYCREIPKSSLIWYCFPPENKLNFLDDNDREKKSKTSDAFVAQLNNFQMGWNKCRAMWMGNWDNQNEFSTSQFLLLLSRNMRKKNDNDNDGRKEKFNLFNDFNWGWFCF